MEINDQDFVDGVMLAGTSSLLLAQAATLLRAAKSEVFREHIKQPCECPACRLWYAIDEWEGAYRTIR